MATIATGAPLIAMQKDLEKINEILGKGQYPACLIAPSTLDLLRSITTTAGTTLSLA
jgi:hypothetical protein